MFVHVTQARYCGEYKVWVSFNDSAEGDVDFMLAEITGSAEGLK